MPATLYTFTPQAASPPFSFQPMLDDNVYQARVTWNVFGQRWYIGLTTANNTPVFLQALVGSPQLVDVQAARWDNGFAILTAEFPRTFVVGDSFDVTITDFVPATYNTMRTLALVTKPNEIMYPLATPPQPVLRLGRATYDINLAGGYFIQSSLVFRAASRQFEVYSP